MRWWLGVVLGVLALAPRLASAEVADVCSLMSKIDQRALAYDDQEYLTTIQYRESSKLVKTFKLRVVTKGMHKALVSFLAPGDMRDTRVLIVDAETMYTYMPDFGRVRRVAGHSRRQSFMGTNLYYEDITERRYSERWGCTPAKNTSDAYVMDLRPNPGAKSAYTKVRVSVDRRREEIVQIEYYEETRHIKSQFREQFRSMNGIERASVIRFVSRDHDADLTVNYDEWRANIGVPESAFTQRALLRGI
jgi:outer membrane lipoprotein-sorting protein